MSFLRNITQYPGRVFRQWDDWRIKSSVVLAVSGMVWSMVSANRAYPRRWTRAGLALGCTGLYFYLIASIRLWFEERSKVSSRRSSNVQSISTSGISGSGTSSKSLNTNSTDPSQSSNYRSISTSDDLPSDVEEALRDQGGDRGDISHIIADAMKDYKESSENDEDYHLMSQVEIMKKIALLLKKCERHIGAKECAQSQALHREIAKVLKNFENSLKPKSQSNSTAEDEIRNNDSVSGDTPEDAGDLAIGDEGLPIRIKLPPALEGELIEDYDMKYQQCNNFIEDPLNALSVVENLLPEISDLEDELIYRLNNDQFNHVPKNGSIGNLNESLNLENTKDSNYPTHENRKKSSSPDASTMDNSAIGGLNSSGADEFHSKVSSSLRSPKSEIHEEKTISDRYKNNHDFANFSECDSNNRERFGSDSFSQDDLSVSVSVTKSMSDSCRMDLSLFDISMMDVSQIPETSDVVPKLALNDAFIDEENIGQLNAPHSKEESNEF